MCLSSFRFRFAHRDVDAALSIGASSQFRMASCKLHAMASMIAESRARQALVQTSQLQLQACLISPHSS
jgi:hypothetical protein